MNRLLLLFLLVPLSSYAYEPQFTIKDEHINQNFRNIAAELRNLNSETITVSSNVNVNGGQAILKNAGLVFSTTAGSYGITFQDMTTLITRPIVSTAAVVANLDALNVFVTTASTKIDAGGIFITTATSVIDAHQAFLSTSSTKMFATGLFITTATSIIDAHTAFISTFPAGVIPSSATGTYPLSISGIATTATNATNASAVLLVNEELNAVYYNIFAPNYSGNQALKTTTTYTYNPATGILIAPNGHFSNNLTASSGTFKSAFSVGTSTTFIVSNGEVYAANIADSTETAITFISTASTKISALGLGITTAASLTADNIYTGINTFTSSMTTQGDAVAHRFVISPAWQTNTRVGADNGGGITTGVNNILIGNNLFLNNPAGSDNVIIGKGIINATCAGGCVAVSSNVIIGSGAGSGIEDTASANVIIGYSAGTAVGTSTGNIIIGHKAVAASGSSQLNIGGILKGNLANTGGITVIGSMTVTGISKQAKILVAGQPEYSAKLDVTGNISATGQIISSGSGNNYFNGKVGINNTAPAYNLHITGNMGVNTITTTSTTFQGTGGITTGAKFYYNPVGAPGQYWANVYYNAAVANFEGLWLDSVGYLGGAGVIVMNPSGGKVGIGNNSPDTLLTVGSTTVTDNWIFKLEDADGTCQGNPESSAVTWSCSSDSKFKKNIRPAVSSLDKLSQYQIRNYEARKRVVSGDSYVLVDTTGTKTGVIAQEVEVFAPDKVQNWSTGKAVESPGIWELVKAIQELEARIKVLETP